MINKLVLGIFSLFLLQISGLLIYRPALNANIITCLYLTLEILLISAYFSYYCRRPLHVSHSAKALALTAVKQFSYAFLACILLKIAIVTSRGLYKNFEFHLENLTLALVFYAFYHSLLFAVIEEIISRGVMLRFFIRIFKGRSSIITSVILQAAIFSYLHKYRFEITTYSLSVFFFGVLAAIVALKTNALWMSFGLHTAWNFCTDIMNGAHDKRMPKYLGIASFDAGFSQFHLFWLVIATVVAY